MNFSITPRVGAAVLSALIIAALTLGAVGLTSAAAANTTPSAPRALTAKSAVANTTDVAVTWSAPAVAGTSARTAYDLQSSTSSSFSGATTTHLAAGATKTTIALPTEGTYFLRIAAANKAGVGNYSSPIEVTYKVTGTTGGVATYSCTSGTLSGATCTTMTSSPANQEPTYSCAPGTGSLNGSDCYVVTSYAAMATPITQEECPSGWSGPSGTTCYRYITTTQANCTNNSGSWLGGSSNNCELYTSEETVTTGETYSCNGSDVLSGTTCTRTTSSPAAQGPPYTYVCVAPAVLSEQTCITTTTTPATNSVSPIVDVYGYTEVGLTVTTTTTTIPVTTTTILGAALHFTAVVVPFAPNSARLSARENATIATLARKVVGLPAGATLTSVTVRGYADPIKSGKFNHALALSRASAVANAFASRLSATSAYLYKLNVVAGGIKFSKTLSEHGSASARRAVIVVDYTS